VTTGRFEVFPVGPLDIKLLPMLKGEADIGQLCTQLLDIIAKGELGLRRQGEGDLTKSETPDSVEGAVRESLGRYTEHSLLIFE
jgi:hypothetical protein